MEMHIQDYPVYVRIGCMSNERLAGLELLVSLSLEIEAKADAVTEDLSTSIDYVALFRCMDATVAHREIPLVENVVRDIGAALMDQFPKIKNLNLAVTKPKLPDGKGRGIGITISDTFTREDKPAVY